MKRAGMFSIGLLLCAMALYAEPMPEPDRPYRDGPLTAADFQAEPDLSQGFAAYTKTNFRHRYRYRYRTQGGDTVVTLTEVEVWGTVARDKSWNRRQRDAALMDHEQGHFDLTQIFALSAQAELREQLKKGRAPQGRAKNQDAAVKRLEARLLEVMEPFIAESITAHTQYDKETGNGTDIVAQAEARRDHKRRLEALLDAIEAATP